VLAAGPDTLAPPPGTAVTAMPILITADGRIVSTAYSDEYGGAYAERMLLAAPLLLEVPNGLDHRRASLTEPMAVGLHAVAKSAIGNAHAAVVMGCGPVGLAVIAACRLAGVELVVAADLSPRRRALAEAMGAHVVVDAARESAVAAWRKADGTRPVVIFEAVGVPGMIDAALREAPRDARVVVVGVCMEPDTVQPFFGIAKELEVRFVLGYTPDEFAASLRHIAEGDIDVAPLITSVVGLDGVAPAFEALSRPDEQAKILVEP
jgi:threonine dehydrogenase-like Zn-dependent dehydrogenase